MFYSNLSIAALLAVFLMFSLQDVSFARRNARGENKANAFVAFHVNTKTVVRRARMVQKRLLQVDPLFNGTLEPPNAFHVAVDIFNLDEKNTGLAKKALARAAKVFSEAEHTNTVKFRGVSSFGNSTLYGSVQCGKSNSTVHRLRQIVDASFAGEGIPSLWNHPMYFPHMTIAQFEGDTAQPLGGKWDPLLSEDYSFGKHTIKAIQLCRTPPDGRIHGNYKVIAEEKV